MFHRDFALSRFDTAVQFCRFLRAEPHPWRCSTGRTTGTSTSFCHVPDEQLCQMAVKRRSWTVTVQLNAVAPLTEPNVKPRKHSPLMLPHCSFDRWQQQKQNKTKKPRVIHCEMPICTLLVLCAALICTFFVGKHLLWPPSLYLPRPGFCFPNKILSLLHLLDHISLMLSATNVFIMSGS